MAMAFRREVRGFKRSHRQRTSAPGNPHIAAASLLRNDVRFYFIYKGSKMQKIKENVFYRVEQPVGRFSGHLMLT